MKESRAEQGRLSPIPMRRTPLRRRFLALAAVFAALTGWQALLNARMLAAQTPATAATTAPQAVPEKKPAHNAKHSQTKPSPAVPTTPVAPAAPAAPPAPDWPANDSPVTATVVWDSHGLLVDAGNSSLQQILKDISTATGAKVEGLGIDQRVFGTYGPGPARDVVSQLLEGSGYNVMMIGDQGEGTPRQIVLSARPSGPAPISNNGQIVNSEQETEADQQPVQPMPYRNGLVPPPQRTPDEMREERQQRLEQIQQQNGQPNGQPNNQPN